MARRIKSKLRKHYGNRTFGGGNTKNRRGKGSRGGVGRAGFHKHKRLQYLKMEGPSTTAPGFVNVTRKSTEEISLKQVARMIEAGKFQKKDDAYEVDLRRKGRRVKLLGNGPFSFKASISVDACSASAREKVEGAGGKVVLAKERREGDAGRQS